ncbi:MAG: DNA replication and repair protein RecF [Acholeplasmataceae bacterium]
MIRRIVLRNFRCHEMIDLKFDQSFVYIEGPNGSGKTSILESIYFAATTKSHRTTDESNMIRENQPFMHTKVVTDKSTYDIVLTKEGKRASINKVEKRKLSEFIGDLKVVMFSPEDLELIKGSPGYRRQFIDLELMKLDKSYLQALSQYKQILKQRNALLKRLDKESDLTFLNILGEQLYEVGSFIIDERQTFLDHLNERLKTIYKQFNDVQVEILYKPHVTKENFLKHIKNNQKQDIFYEQTIAGPHKDDFFMTFKGFDAKTHASQGEQRLLVVSLKLALLGYIEDVTKDNVVLLLDDVLSELDKEKQSIFLKGLPKNIQVIMNSAILINEKNIQMIHLKKEE